MTLRLRLIPMLRSMDLLRLWVMLECFNQAGGFVQGKMWLFHRVTKL